MKFSSEATDEAILHELGERLAQGRLEKNLTQAQLSTQAGISKRTLERMESGEVATQLSAFIRVCRVLDLIEQLEQLVPAARPGPIAQLKNRGRKRQRASVTGKASVVKESPPTSGTWTWGESS